MRTKRRRSAFTLVEVLVASSIFLVVLSLMYSTYLAGTDLWQSHSEDLELQAKARACLDRMTSELKGATRTSGRNPSPNLTIPSAPNNNAAHFYLPRDNDGDGLLTDAGGAIEWDTNNQIKYDYVPGQRELRRLEKGQFDILATDVDSVQFTDASMDNTLPLTEVRVALTLSSVTPRGRMVTAACSASVKLRN
jgi:prepilin-type N-terminal cleavage/methylation domain-containing protein